MTPLEALARLAAIVPPPRYPLLRFHGVLAPRHRWRARVVPQPPSPAKACRVTARELASGKSTAAERGIPASSRRRTRGLPPRGRGGRRDLVADDHRQGRAGGAECPLDHGAHKERILEGELYAATARIDWRTLLKRTFDQQTNCSRRRARGRSRSDHTSVPSAARSGNRDGHEATALGRRSGHLPSS